MPELITDVYNKYIAGDLKGSLEAQFKLNPVRLSMDGASFPVAAKDMANLRGREERNEDCGINLNFVYIIPLKTLKPESSIQSVPKEILIAWNKMKCTLTFNKKTVAKQIQRSPSLDLSGSSLFVLYEKIRRKR